jgi:MFS family permease
MTFFLIWALPFLIGSILAGVMFDSMGRNFPTIVGLAVTGVSLAVFGVLGIRSGYIFLVPLAFGFSIATVFSLIVWAELAPEYSRGKYYGAGMALIALALLLGLFSAGSIFGSISSSRIKSYIMFASVALFLGIPPLIMAEELLPKELIEQRRFQEYIEQARKKYIK